MKKVIFGTALVFGALVSVVAVSCVKGLDCAALAVDVSQKAQAWVNADGTANEAQACKDYKAALQKWLAESKCYNADPTTKAAYEDLITMLNSECP